MMSVINIKYDDVAFECILPGTTAFVFSGRKVLAPMPFTQKCVHCMVTIVLFDQQYMFHVRNLLSRENVVEQK